jgi:hypothetical protein
MNRADSAGKIGGTCMTVMLILGETGERVAAR